MNYVFTITAKVNLIQNKKDIFDKPEIEVNIILQKINIHLKHKQLKDIISMLELVSAYSRFNKRKLDLIIDKWEKLLPEKDTYRSDFTSLFT